MDIGFKHVCPVDIQITAFQIAVAQSCLIICTAPQGPVQLQTTGIGCFVINGGLVILLGEADKETQGFPHGLVDRDTRTGAAF